MSSARKALLQSTALNASEKHLLNRISLRVSREDGMYRPGKSRHYLSVGLSAMRCIDRALQHTQTDVTTILDLPSGFGRVLRFVTSRFENTHITACELDPGAVRFCERAFGVAGALSTKNLFALSFQRQFDLIWCGSLATHLDQSRTTDLLRCFSRHLAPGGLCLVTTHGETVPWLQRHYRRAEFLAQLTEFGYAYLDNIQPGYGTSIVSFERMREIALESGDWCLAVFLQRGWDDHQDVYGFFKPHTGGTLLKPLIVNAISTQKTLAWPSSACSNVRVAALPPLLNSMA